MIYINDIPSLRDPESCEFFLDDRIEKIELINGNAVQDYGHVESGDYLSLECVFFNESWAKIRVLWVNRQLVTFTDEAGVVWFNMRLVVRRIRYERKYPAFVRVFFELWRV